MTVQETPSQAKIAHVDDWASDIWSDDLQCCWVRWSVGGPSFLRLDLPPVSCCDMTGAIKVGRSLMPRVSYIECFSGGQLDVVYLLRDGQWGATVER